MGDITFDYRDPEQSGTDSLTKGALSARLWQREIVSGKFRTIDHFTIPLVDGHAVAVLSDTSVDQCWVVKELAPIAGRKTFYKAVAGDAAFTDLVDVNPSTLEPIASMPSIADVIAAGDAVNAAAIAAEAALRIQGDGENADDIAAEAAARATAVSAEATARADADALLIPLTQKGAVSGVASLDGSGAVPVAQLTAVPELARDAVGTALVGTGIATVTVNDAGDTITLDVPAYSRTEADAKFISRESSHLFNFDATKLRKATLALQKVRNGDADMKILCVGDSTTAGAKGSTAATYVGKKAYPHRLAELLNSYFVPAAPGLSTPRGSSTAITADTRWVAGSGWTLSGWSNAYAGFGGKGTNFQGVGITAGSLVFQDPLILADTFDVYYRRAPSGSTTGTFTVTATGGGTTTVDAAATGGAPRTAKVTVTAAAALTTNSVTIAGTVAAKNVEILGIEPSLSTTRKVRLGNAGVSGSTSLDWVTYSSNSTSNDFGGIGCIKGYTPDLTIIDLGINDASALIATVSDYITRLQLLITAAQITGDVILKTMLPSQDPTVAALEAQYVAAVKLLGLPVIDQFTRVSPYADYYAAGMMNADGLHGTDYGYLDVAQFVMLALRSY